MGTNNTTETMKRTWNASETQGGEKRGMHRERTANAPRRSGRRTRKVFETHSGQNNGTHGECMQGAVVRIPSLS